ncbi:MAG: glycosyltransferase family 2 protein [Planctomycetaceae bacterium]|nr:glycosyltransferase family 2 protein [Planctomycetaceae bacterium]
MLFISIIIPVRNESLHIEEVLDRLLEQNYDPAKYEILVIDGQSDDDTWEKVARYVEKYPQVRLLDNPKRLSSAARNVGIQNAKGDAVLLIDGHCIIDSKEMLRNVDAAFQSSGADCLGRPQPLELSQAGAMQLAIAAARRSPIGHHPDSFIYAGKACFSPAISVAVAYRKEVFEKIGLFDERFDAAEDCELNHRIDKAELKCYFSPDIAVRYVPRATLSGLAKQLIRYGKGRVRLSRKHPETFSWKSFLPAAFVAGLILGVVLCLLWGLLASSGLGHTLLKAACFLYLGIVAFYLIVVFGESFRLAFSLRKWFYYFLLPPVFVTLHIASGWGVLKETLFPTERIGAANISHRRTGCGG